MKNHRELPSRDEILEYYDFNYETGQFFHKRSVGRVKAGDVAGTHSDGYLRISVRGKQYYAHRIVPVMMGLPPLPGEVIDHANRDAVDNRPTNLRITDQRGNGLNAKVSKASTTGATGVSFNRRRGQYEAYIASAPYTKAHLGWHRDLASAIAARKAAEARLVAA